jgi:hypothetical protein
MESTYPEWTNIIRPQRKALPTFSPGGLPSISSSTILTVSDTRHVQRTSRRPVGMYIQLVRAELVDFVIRRSVVILFHKCDCSWVTEASFVQFSLPGSSCKVPSWLIRFSKDADPSDVDVAATDKLLRARGWRRLTTRPG